MVGPLGMRPRAAQQPTDGSREHPELSQERTRILSLDVVLAAEYRAPNGRTTCTPTSFSINTLTELRPADLATRGDASAKVA